MSKGFSESEVNSDKSSKELPKENSNIFSILKEKKFTYTLPGKKQINIFGSIVLSLNIILVILVILYLNNEVFRDFIFNIGR